MLFSHQALAPPFNPQRFGVKHEDQIGVAIGNQQVPGSETLKESGQLLAQWFGIIGMNRSAKHFRPFHPGRGDAVVDTKNIDFRIRLDDVVDWNPLHDFTGRGVYFKQGK